MVFLGWALAAMDRFDEARSLLQRALAIREQRPGADPLAMAGVLHNLGLTERGADRPELAEAYLRRALAIETEPLPPANASRLAGVRALAVALAQSGRAVQAVPLMQDVLAQQRAVHGADSLVVANTLNEGAGAGAGAGPQFHAAARRRSRPAMPARPTSSNAVLPGSGTAAIEPGNTPEPETTVLPGGPL